MSATIESSGPFLVYADAEFKAGDNGNSRHFQRCGFARTVGREDLGATVREVCEAGHLSVVMVDLADPEKLAGLVHAGLIARMV